MRANVGKRPTLTHDRPKNEPHLLGPRHGIATIREKLYEAKAWGALGSDSPIRSQGTVDGSSDQRKFTVRLFGVVVLRQRVLTRVLFYCGRYSGYAPARFLNQDCRQAWVEEQRYTDGIRTV